MANFEPNSADTGLTINRAPPDVPDACGASAPCRCARLDISATKASKGSSLANTGACRAAALCAPGGLPPHGEARYHDGRVVKSSLQTSSSGVVTSWRLLACIPLDGKEIEDLGPSPTRLRRRGRSRAAGASIVGGPASDCAILTGNRSGTLSCRECRPIAGLGRDYAEIGLSDVLKPTLDSRRHSTALGGSLWGPAPNPIFSPRGGSSRGRGTVMVGPLLTSPRDDRSLAALLTTSSLVKA